MKFPKFYKRPSLLSVIMGLALVFLAGVLVSSAVTQFSQRLWFSGCVSILGVILVVMAGALLGMDLRKKTKQEGNNDG